MLIKFTDFIKIRIKNYDKNKINLYKKKYIQHIIPNYFDEEYIDKIIFDNNNLFYVFIISSDITTFQKNDDIGFIIIRKIFHNNYKQHFAIPLFAITFSMRKYGYGKLLLDELKLLLLSKKYIRYHLILHSLKNSLNFYLNYGFHVITKNKYLQSIENISKQDFLLEYVF